MPPLGAPFGCASGHPAELPGLDARGFYEEFDSLTGRHRYPGWPLRINPGPARHHRFAAPTLGRHNDEAFLYRNDHGKFVNVAREARVEDYGSGMSVSFGDFNRDGKVDLYVGNMFSSAGNLVRVPLSDREISHCAFESRARANSRWPRRLSRPGFQSLLRCQL